jgi:hypothetical protein
MSNRFLTPVAAARIKGAMLGLIVGGVLLWLMRSASPVTPARKFLGHQNHIQAVGLATTTVPQEKEDKNLLQLGKGPILSGAAHVEAKVRSVPATKAKGFLGINVIPGSVKVYVDGRLCKDSIPFEIQIDVGPHTIMIADPMAPASARIVRRVIIKANSRTEIVERM